MLTFSETLSLSALMGFSIYLSLPIILSRSIGRVPTKVLIGMAIGILIFLMGDVFLDASSSLYNGSLYGYGSSPEYDLIFAGSLSAGFLILFIAGHRWKRNLTPTVLAFIIALGVAFQNLTEGLVFGSLGVKMGLTGAALVVLIGFILQNFTEGFPIASPFLSSSERKIGVMSGALLVGGVPAILGGAVGYYYNSSTFDMVFYGLAIGTILYVILPMLRNLLQEPDSEMVSAVYAGVFFGFILGFAVNLL